MAGVKEAFNGGKVHIVYWSKDIIAPVPANIHIGKGIVKLSLDNLKNRQDSKRNAKLLIIIDCTLHSIIVKVNSVFKY